MAEGDAWAGIQRHGLLTAEGLIHLFEVSAATADLVLTQRRAQAVRLVHPERGFAVLRDQKPIREAALEKCLTRGLSSADWLRILNAQVYLFPKPAEGTSTFAAYAHLPVLVLQLNTASLVKAHAERIRVCPINSGYFERRPAMRGEETFQPLVGGGDAPLGVVKEVTVQGGVLDVLRHLESVTRCFPDGGRQRMWPLNDPRP